MTTRRLGRTDLSIETLIYGCNVLGWTLEEAAAYRVLDVAFSPISAAISAAYSRLFQEGAKGLSGALAVSRRLIPWELSGPVVCLVSGGNNDLSRYAEVVERSLLHEGLRHYFLVTFPQEPGALRHFLDEVLAKGEDIVAFEYVKKNNRETGPALVGIELERADDLGDLLARMEASPLEIERVPPGSPLFSFLL